MRSIWTGSISFGLINIPIKLISAVQESSLNLDMLDSKDHSNIKFKSVNESTGKEVAYENIVKGYKMESDYVILEDEDFEAADAAKTKTIEIINFVNEEEIDSLYYEHPYYLEPQKPASQEIKEPSELNLPPISETKTKEMDIANKLIEQLTEKFSIKNYKDTFTDKLLEIIKKKSKGKKRSVPKMKVVHKQNDNLMDMLKASLAGKKSKSA